LKNHLKKLFLPILLALGLAFGFAAGGQLVAAAPAASETVASETQASEAAAETEAESLDVERAGQYYWGSMDCRYWYSTYQNGGKSGEWWKTYIWWVPNGWEFLGGQRAHWVWVESVWKPYYWRNYDANGVACY
jgi:hypothetical protein